MRRTTHFRTAGRRLLLASCLLALLLIPAGAAATPGELDPSFGQGGRVTTVIGSGDDNAYALTLRADGRLVAAGTTWNGSDYDFALARYHPDGSLDGSFGSGGKVMTSYGSGHEAISDLVQQRDGKLVAAGYSSHGSTSDFALARYNGDGTLDAGFGTGGKVAVALGTGAEDGANALVLQPDGKLVAAGGVRSGSTSVFALARFNANGTLDTSFGQGGKVTTGIGSAPYAGANSLALQPDGKLVVAGFAYGGSNTDVVVARYNSTGALDPSFGSGGIVTTAIGPRDDFAYALALQPDGKLVVAGNSWNGSDYELALARYLSNGALDPSFGSGGTVTTAIGTGSASAEALVVDPDGRLVVAGSTNDIGGLEHFALARFSPNGTLDPSFGSGGKLMTAVSSGHDDANALALQRDGKVVAAGSSHKGTGGFEFALVRYLGDPPPPRVTCVVPRLKGKTLRAAKRTLTKAHCSVGKLSRAFSAKVKKGRVIASKPRPGRKLAQGTKIRLQVSKGKK